MRILTILFAAIVKKILTIMSFMNEGYYLKCLYVEHIDIWRKIFMCLLERNIDILNRRKLCHYCRKIFMTLLEEHIYVLIWKNIYFLTGGKYLCTYWGKILIFWIDENVYIFDGEKCLCHYSRKIFMYLLEENIYDFTRWKYLYFLGANI